MEEVRERCRARRHELGGRHRVRPGSRLLRQHLPLPELSDTVVVAGEITARGRLPLREQGELRTARAQHAALHAAGPAHTARVQLQVVHRVAAVEVQARAGLRTGEAERHRGVQLPRRRHCGHQLPADRLLQPGLQRRAARLSEAGQHGQPDAPAAAGRLRPLLCSRTQPHLVQPADVWQGHHPPC